MENLSNSRKDFKERFSGKTSTHRRYEREGKVLGRVPKIGCEESRIREVGKATFGPLSSGQGDKRETRFPRGQLRGTKRAPTKLWGRALVSFCQQ